MTSRVVDFLKVMREAEMQGDVAEPAALHIALREEADPIRALSNNDRANVLFATVYSEFGFICNARGMRNPLKPLECSRLASLVRWLIRELMGWRSVEDPTYRKLAAIFIVAAAVDLENSLWNMMPIEIGNNLDLIQSLTNLIRSFAITFTSPDGIAEPIWEREAVEKFKVADKEGDWVGIGSMVSLFERQIFFTFTGIVQSQSVQCLHRCGMNHLVEALGNLHQTLLAIQVASILPAEQRLALATASSNPYIQFGCIYQTLSRRHTAQQASIEEQRLLTTLLLNVAEDGPRWVAWMQVFNAHPIRYPTLQISLGHALADVPLAAMVAYVNAINLNAKPTKPDPGREAVAECLRAFRARATHNRRESLWRHAHERWLAWNFDHVSPDNPLLGINWSDLDYAVVAFACECMNDAERTVAMNTVWEKMTSLDDRWHASVTDIVSEWNRLLSQFQPYAHASNVIISGDDWLPETRTYLPFDSSTNEYLVSKYRLGV